MPTIDVPDPLATYIVYGVFLCLCFGQFAIGYFVPQRYRRSRHKKTAPGPEGTGAADQLQV